MVNKLFSFCTSTNTGALLFPRYPNHNPDRLTRPQQLSYPSNERKPIIWQIGSTKGHVGPEGTIKPIWLNCVAERHTKTSLALDPRNYLSIAELLKEIDMKHNHNNNRK